MRKRILIWSILVLTLLLLMPSIPAIQHKTIKDNALSDFKKLDINNFNNLNQQEVDKLEGLIICFKEKLVNTQSREQVIAIFNEFLHSSDIGVKTPGLWILFFILDVLNFIYKIIDNAGNIISKIIGNMIERISNIIELINEGEFLTYMIETTIERIKLIITVIINISIHIFFTIDFLIWYFTHY